jgi:hypothetical protein
VAPDVFTNATALQRFRTSNGDRLETSRLLKFAPEEHCLVLRWKELDRG